MLPLPIIIHLEAWLLCYRDALHNMIVVIVRVGFTMITIMTGIIVVFDI